jgi:hypothetical protein
MKVRTFYRFFPGLIVSIFVGAALQLSAGTESGPSRNSLTPHLSMNRAPGGTEGSRSMSEPHLESAPGMQAAPQTSIVSAPAAAAPSQVTPVPSSKPNTAALPKLGLDPRGIAADCSEDVTAKLMAWIASEPNGATLSFKPRGCYRIDGSLLIENRFGLVFQGNGATFKAGSDGDRDRRHFWFFGGGNLTLRNLTVVGANANGGTAEAAWRTDREFQHAFALQGVQGILLDNVRAQNVYGDFVYIGPEVMRRGKKFVWSRRVTVQNSEFKRNGRQGIAIVAGEDVLIARNYLGQVRRSTFDIEPTAPHWGARRVKIINNTTGAGRLLWLASGGHGYKVNDIYIAGNVMKARMGTPVFKVETSNDGSGQRRGPFVIEGNTFIVGGSPAAGFDCAGCVGLTIRNNHVTFPADRQMTAVKIKSSDATWVTGNNLTGAAVVLKADSSSSDYHESGNSR